MTAIEARAPTDRPSGSGAVAVPPTIEVRRAREADIPVLAEVLARAFANDPAISFFVKPADRRHERMVAGMEAMLRYGSAHFSDTYTTADLAGAAIWTPPGYSGLSLREWPGMLRQSLFMCGWRGLVAIVSMHRLLEERLKRHVPEHNYYLSVLGVDPARQGQGIGSALMQPILERCDLERVPASLATNLERNVRLYERHGFRVVDELPIPGTTIPTGSCAATRPEHAWDRAVRHGEEHLAGRGLDHAQAATSRPMPLDSGARRTHHRASGRL